MSLWGNTDKSTLTGTVTVASNSATVTGSGTAFTDEIGVGDLLMVTTDTVANRVSTITSDTVLTLTANYAGADAGASKAVHKRETPRNLSIVDSNAVLGASVAEMTGGGDNVVSIAINNAGTGYASAPAVSFGSGNTTSTATVAGGKVTALSITGTNTGHTLGQPPTVTIAPPAAKTFNGASNVANNAITENAHGFATGDALTYSHTGGTVVGGLVIDTTYYAINLTTDTLSLAIDADNAESGTAITLTDGAGENHTLTGVTATAVAALGSGNTVVHPGWITRTVGTGGRAGRINYETLVAMGSITTDDAADDPVLPE